MSRLGSSLKCMHASRKNNSDGRMRFACVSLDYGLQVDTKSDILNACTLSSGGVCAKVSALVEQTTCSCIVRPYIVADSHVSVCELQHVEVCCVRI